MKKILLSLAVLFCVSYAASAQVNSNAIGLRLGWGVELSYQHALSESSRLEFDLGLAGFDAKAFNLTGMWQRVYSLSDVTPGLNWYWGVGAGIGIWHKNFSVSVAGDIGLEYNLPKAPVQFSLDWRPALGIVTGGEGLGFWWEGICLGVRYKF